MTRDTFDINNVLNVNGVAVRRHPCMPTLLGQTPEGTPILSQTPPPFAGVTDLEMNVPVCNPDGTVNNAILAQGSDPWNQDTVNAEQILPVLEPGLWGEREELHAQVFAEHRW